MRLDTFSGGRRTNKTTRYMKSRVAHDIGDLPSLNPDGTSTERGRAPINADKAEKYQIWLNTREWPIYGSTTKWQSYQHGVSQLRRTCKKQRRIASVRYATNDIVLGDPIPRKSGFQHSRVKGYSTF